MYLYLDSTNCKVFRLARGCLVWRPDFVEICLLAVGADGYTPVAGAV